MAQFPLVCSGRNTLQMTTELTPAVATLPYLKTSLKDEMSFRMTPLES